MVPVWAPYRPRVIHVERVLIASGFACPRTAWQYFDDIMPETEKFEHRLMCKRGRARAAAPRAPEGTFVSNEQREHLDAE
jgi:hypothetical protein